MSAITSQAGSVLIREWWVRSLHCLGREYGPFGSVAECRRFMRQTNQTWTATIFSRFGDGKPKPVESSTVEPPEGVPSGVSDLIGEGIPDWAHVSDSESLSVHDIDLDEWPACDICGGDGSLSDGSRCIGCGGVGVQRPGSGTWESTR